jgi:DNA-binding transcriptional ArsR family regulator
MFAALGNDARLKIVRLLLAAHPAGMFPGDMQTELGIPASTLSHHLEKLRNQRLVTVARESTFLRYRADTDQLKALLDYLYQDCCTRADSPLVPGPDQK